jgi:outer membrane protein assembly factor BamD (BamD/ComL family)
MRTRITANTNTRRSEIRYRLLCATLVIGLILLSGITGVTAAQEKTTRGRSTQLAQQSSNDAAAVIFRSGRDLITEQNWVKAQEKFNQLVTTYPNDKNNDAAL